LNGTLYDINNETEYKLENGKGFLKEYGYYVRRDIKYEGEYLNGELNGKGKQYDEGKLVFEGIFKNGKRWNGKGYNINNNEIAYEIKEGKGIIKEYDYEGKLIFEYEYLNGEFNGKGKEYNYEGKLIFVCEYLNGEFNGKGKEYNYKGECIFEGEYLYDFRLKGKEYIKGRSEYEGEYLYDKKWNGKGHDEKGNITYILNNGWKGKRIQ